MTRITGGLKITGGARIGSLQLPRLRFDPSYITGGIPVGLSDNNTTVYDMNSGSFTVIGTNSIPLTGAYMFTIKQDVNSDAQLGPDIGGYIGVGNRNFNNSNYTGADNNSIGFSDTGLLFFNGSSIESGFPTFNTNSVRIIDVAILNNAYIWIRVDGGYWNGSSSSNLLDGTGGYSLAGTNFTELYPMVTVAGDINFSAYTILPTSPYGVPSGVTFFNQYNPAPTPSYAPSIVADSPFGAGSSYLFNGTDQKITVDASSLNLGSGGSDWTIEWFQKETVPNPFSRPWMTVNGFGVSIEKAGGGDPGTFYFWSPALVNYGSVNRMNAWHHFAIVSTGGNITAYFDGVGLGNTTITPPSFTGDTLQIGGKPGGSTDEQFGGYITDFRWTEGVAVYTGNFTVPNSPLLSTQGGGININAISAGQVKILIKP